MKISTEDQEEQIAELQEQIKGIQRKIIIDYKAVAYPKRGTEYWTIYAWVGKAVWIDSELDKARFDSGAYFATEKEADSEYEWRVLNVQILNSIAAINKERNWVVNWENPNQDQYRLEWDRKHWKVRASTSLFGDTGCKKKHFFWTAQDKLYTLYTQKQFKFWLTKEKDNETT